MYSEHDRQLAMLLRISRDLDIVGDVSADVDHPSELIAWASLLTDPAVIAWRAQDSGHRYVQVTAQHTRAPIRGRVAAVLTCERHTDFWHELDLDGMLPGQERTLPLSDLSAAWAAIPLTPPESEVQP